MSSDRDEYGRDEFGLEECDDDTRLRPDCPVCGEPIAFITATGPHTGSVGPCGCSVPPALLERHRDG